MSSNTVSALMLAFAILVPLDRIIGPANTTLADLAMVALVLYFWPILWRARKPANFPLILPQWLILVGGLASTLVSLDRTDSIRTIVGDLYLYVWFVTVCNATQDERTLSKVQRAWVVVAFVVALLVLLGYSGLGPRATLPLRGTWNADVKRQAIGALDLAIWSGRGMGTFFDPNAAGGYLVISFFIFLGTTFPRRRIVRAGIAICLLAGIVGTGSNGALAGLVAGVFGLVLLLSTPKAAMAWISAGAVIVCVLALGFMTVASPEAVTHSVAGIAPLRLTFGRLEDGIQGRLGLLAAGWRAYLEAPLGLGPLGSRATEIGKGLHNEYAGYLVERGILALLGLLLMMGEVLRCLSSSVSLTDADRAHRYQVATLLGAFVAIAVSALSHEVLHSRSLWFLFALIFLQNGLLRSKTRADSLRSAGKGLRTLHSGFA